MFFLMCLFRHLIAWGFALQSMICFKVLIFCLYDVRDLSTFFFFFNLWLCWVFVSVRELSLLAASGGHSSSRCTGLSLSRPLLLQSTGSRRAGSVIVAHGPSCSGACGIFPDQGSNLCPLHWQADSQPLCHQGSPCLLFFKLGIIDLQCYISFRCGTLWFNIFVDYTSYKVIIKYWLYSLCCTLHPCNLFYNW